MPLGSDSRRVRKQRITEGGIVGHGLDGHTTRLGGTIDVRTKWNDAQLTYIDACKKMGASCCKVDDAGKATCSMGGGCCSKPAK